MTGTISQHLMERLLSICGTPEDRDALVEAIKTGGGDLTGDEIAYDNTTSGLTAEDVQAAIDELATGSGGGGVSSVNGQTGDVTLTATDISAANTNLSNLSTPTSINQDLLFVNKNIRIGASAFSGGNPLANIHTSAVTLADLVPSSTFNVYIACSGQSQSYTIQLPTNAPTANSHLVSNSLGELSWVAGASGTFTSQDGKTITVVSGLITSIV